jgi:5-methylcytosine-specific restriction endonuclease McrA
MATWQKSDPYQHLRGSQRWKTLRESILRDQQGMCALCAGLAVDVHHKAMATEANFFDRSNLIGLCPDCHKKTHAAYKRGLTWRLIHGRD